VASLGAGMQMMMRHEQTLGWGRGAQCAPRSGLCRYSSVIAVALTRQSFIFEECFSRRRMDTWVKPAYDNGRFQEAGLLFFVLSKTFGIMLLPTNFLIGVGLIGAILLPTRLMSLGRKLLIASVVLLAICGFSPFGYWVLYPLESRFPPWDASRGAPDGIVVLGGAIDADLSAERGVAVYSGSADRLIAAAALARRYPNARIIYSGGSANLVSNDAKEADYARAVFESLGIPKERLTMERRSRNTRENAEFSKVIAAPKSGERWLLVTSAYHMPRSIGLFRKAGFAVEPYPVDWHTGARADLLAFSPIAVDGLGRTDTGIREWIGLVAYRATGKIDDLWPGPAAN
jgi:uncharacterized SAM-binding protein YcdF (DUF218 family)